MHRRTRTIHTNSARSKQNHSRLAVASNLNRMGIRWASYCDATHLPIANVALVKRYQNSFETNVQGTITNKVKDSITVCISSV